MNDQDIIKKEIIESLKTIPRIEGLKKIFWEILGFDRENDSLPLDVLPASIIDYLYSIQVFASLADYRVIIGCLKHNIEPTDSTLNNVLDGLFSIWKDSMIIISNYHDSRWVIGFQYSITGEHVIVPLDERYEEVTSFLAGIAKKIETGSMAGPGDLEETIINLSDWEDLDDFIQNNLKEPDFKGQSDIDYWFQNAIKYPLFTPEEEKATLTRLDQIWPLSTRTLVGPCDECARNLYHECILRNLRLVAWISYCYKEQIGGGMELTDFFQEGTIGLSQAIVYFDIRKGCRLTTYSFHWIRQKITRFIDDYCWSIRVPVYMREKWRRYWKYRSLKENTEKNIYHMDDLDFTEKEIYQILTLPLVVKSIDGFENISDDEFNVNSLPSLIIPERIREQTEASLLKETISNCMNVLKPIERFVICHRFGLHNDVPETLEEIGNRINLTRERIRQVENNALRRLRHPKRRHMLLPYYQDY